jgi:hypothetical protein
VSASRGVSPRPAEMTGGGNLSSEKSDLLLRNNRVSHRSVRTELKVVRAYFGKTSLRLTGGEEAVGGLGRVSHRSVNKEPRVTGAYVGDGIATENVSGGSSAIRPVASELWLRTAFRASCKSPESSNSRRLRSLGVNKFSAAVRRSGIFTMGQLAIKLSGNTTVMWVGNTARGAGQKLHGEHQRMRHIVLEHCTEK